jgi:hypothetical protein
MFYQLRLDLTMCLYLVYRLLSATLSETVLGRGWRSFSQVRGKCSTSFISISCLSVSAAAALYQIRWCVSHDSPRDDHSLRANVYFLQAAAPAVFVDKNTKVICQGLTGKNGSFHTEQVRHAQGNCSSCWNS